MAHMPPSPARTQVTDPQTWSARQLAQHMRGGVGHGIGIPHGKTDALAQLNMAIGIPASPIEFGAIDGKPVHLVFLILGGPETSDEHIQVLRKLAALRMNEHFLRFLKGAEGKDQVIETIQEMAGSVA